MAWAVSLWKQKVLYATGQDRFDVSIVGLLIPTATLRHGGRTVHRPDQRRVYIPVLPDSGPFIRRIDMDVGTSNGRSIISKFQIIGGRQPLLC